MVLGTTIGHYTAAVCIHMYHRSGNFRYTVYIMSACYVPYIYTVGCLDAYLCFVSHFKISTTVCTTFPEHIGTVRHFHRSMPTGMQSQHLVATGSDIV